MATSGPHYLVCLLFQKYVESLSCFLEPNTVVIGRKKRDQSVVFSMTIPAVSTEPFSHSVARNHFACCCPSEKKNIYKLYFQHSSDKELINNNYNTTYLLLYKIIFELQKAFADITHLIKTCFLIYLFHSLGGRQVTLNFHPLQVEKQVKQLGQRCRQERSWAVSEESKSTK